MMSLCNQGSLTGILDAKDKRLTSQEVKKLGLDISTALQYLHEVRVRDLVNGLLHSRVITNETFRK